MVYLLVAKMPSIDSGVDTRGTPLDSVGISLRLDLGGVVKEKRDALYLRLIWKGAG